MMCFFQAEDGIRDLVRSRGLGDVYKRQTFRRAEFGFLGVVVYTRVHTPRRWGEPFRAGVLTLSLIHI